MTRGKIHWTWILSSVIMFVRIDFEELIPMKCPFCGFQESKVVDSRHSDDNLSIRRRRECLGCQRRFTT